MTADFSTLLSVPPQVHSMVHGEYRDYDDEEVHERVLTKILNGAPINGLDITVTEVSNYRWSDPDPSQASYFSPPKFASTRVTIPTDQWLRLQHSTRNCSYSDFIKGAYDETVESVAEAIESDDDQNVPAPYLELSPEQFSGELTPTSERDTGACNVHYEPKQEGRSRGLAAQRAGLDQVPVWLAVRRLRK